MNNDRRIRTVFLLARTSFFLFQVCFFYVTILKKWTTFGPMEIVFLYVARQPSYNVTRFQGYSLDDNVVMFGPVTLNCKKNYAMKCRHLLARDCELVKYMLVPSEYIWCIATEQKIRTENINIKYAKIKNDIFWASCYFILFRSTVWRINTPQIKEQRAKVLQARHWREFSKFRVWKKHHDTIHNSKLSIGNYKHSLK